MSKFVRARIYAVIESSERISSLGRIFDACMIVLIVLNVLAVILETIDWMAEAYNAYFYAFEIFSVAVFTVEYALRLWVTAENPDARFRGPIRGRLRYALTPAAIIDFLAIAPFFVSVLIAVDLRFLRVFRLLRLLKLTRYSQAVNSLVVVLHGERRTMGAAMLVMLMLLIFSASIAYLLERDAQPESFASIPDAMWWAMATLTTVGYGDIAPITPLGKLFGGLVMVLGIGMFALPTGILATGFAEEVRKRQFIVSWRLVASVSLFTTLDAVRISEIAGLLQPRTLPPRYTVFRQGDPADGMFFIASGEVEIEIAPDPRILGEGEFFGEIALLQKITRTATAVTVTECQLLFLDADDFEGLCDANPQIHQHMQALMNQRLSESSASAADAGEDGGA